MGADHVLQPTRDEGPGPAAHFLWLPSSDRTHWDEFRARYGELHEELHADFDAFCRAAGAPALPEGEFIHESPYLNLYVYPEEADYERSRPLPSNWHRLDSCVRATDAPFQVPDRLRSGSGRLVYLSLGSLGSADVPLMTRLIDLLAATEHGVIVSLGPQHEQLALADNMAGAEFLPQTSILPQVDVVITHGGNNTVTESFQFGKPMVALPLFWDQYDNAQRIAELGFGARLDPYAFEDPDLEAALGRLLANDGLRATMGGVAGRLQQHPGTAKAASLIGRLARERGPVI